MPAAAVAVGIAAGVGVDSWAVSCSVDRDSIAPPDHRKRANPPRLSCSSDGASDGWLFNDVMRFHASYFDK